VVPAVNNITAIDAPVCHPNIDGPLHRIVIHLKIPERLSLRCDCSSVPLLMSVPEQQFNHGGQCSAHPFHGAFAGERTPDIRSWRYCLLTYLALQLTSTEIDVGNSQLMQLTMRSSPNLTDTRKAKIHRIQFLCKLYSV
jgi:hypothetical protein